jgi:thioredoxin-like negative regulator of GroEL
MPSTRFTRASYKPASVAVTAMPRSADDFLLESLRAELTGCGADREALQLDDGSDEEATKEAAREAKEEAAFLERIRTRAALYPDDGLAQRTLACLELEDGDKAKGAAILDRLVAANPQDAASLRLKALILLAQAGDANEPAAQRKLMNDAGRLLLRANAAEPNDYRTLLNYGRSRRGEADYPNDNILDVLGNAAVLAPQVDDVAIETARAYIMRQRWDDAEKLLTPVASNPHGTTGAAIARSMLAEIERKRGR